jgi:molecular chaperone DnaK (HSP70)
MKRWPFKVINDNGKPKIQIKYINQMKLFALEEISSMVLAKMKEVAEIYLNKKCPMLLLMLHPILMIHNVKQQ